MPPSRGPRRPAGLSTHRCWSCWTRLRASLPSPIWTVSWRRRPDTVSSSSLSGRIWPRSSTRYGGRWATVVNNHRAKLVCSGIADPVTLQHVSGLLGDEERAEHSWTVGDDGRHTRTEAVSVQALAPPGWLRQLPVGEAVLVYGSFPPACIALRPYFAEPALAARAGKGSPGQPGARYGEGRRNRLGTRRARLTAWSPRRS